MNTIDRILQLVDESGLTAKEYAINAGLGAGNITDWKTGRSKPSVESLQKIAKYANVQLEWLTGDSNYKTEQELVKVYLQNIYYNDINDAIIMNMLDNFLFQKTNFNYKKYVNQIKNFFKENTLGELSKLKIQQFINQYPIEDKKNLEKVMYNIFESIRLQQEKRDQYSYLKNSFFRIPVYGQISAGLPNWAEECLDGYLPIDPNLMNIINPEECFFLKINGESMNKVIRNGAYALIRKQDIVENGEIAAILVNEDNATIKKFTRQGDLVILEPMSDDNNFQVQIYDKNTSIKILGKYIGKFEINN